MGWLRLSLDLERQQVDRAAALVESFAALSVTVSDAGDEPVLEPDPGAMPLWNACRLDALFELDLDVRGLRQALNTAGFTANVDFLDDADWLNRWRQYAVDVCFADRLWLVPRDVEAAGEPALRLDPGLAFGSGSHPTTRLCLDWLSQQDLNSCAVLDYGCGSGILALAARKLGCTRVLAIDHDPQALLATQENAAYNELADSRLEIGLPDALGDAQFDVVLANILANPLVELAAKISNALTAAGVLVMSGLLESQAAEVMSAYPMLEFEPPRIEADEQGARWTCLVARQIIESGH